MSLLETTLRDLLRRKLFGQQGPPPAWSEKTGIASIDTPLSGRPRLFDSLGASPQPDSSAPPPLLQPAPLLVAPQTEQAASPDLQPPRQLVPPFQLQPTDAPPDLSGSSVQVSPRVAQDVAPVLNQFAGQSARIGMTARPPDFASLDAQQSPASNAPPPILSPRRAPNLSPPLNAPPAPTLQRPLLGLDNAPLPIFDGQPVVNQFAAPSALASVPPSAPQPDDSSAPQLQTSDASILPVDERRNAILGAPAQDQASLPATTMPAVIDRRMAAAEARRQQLEDAYTKFFQLEGTKAVDQNGRLKSGFLGALRGFLNGGSLVLLKAGFTGLCIRPTMKN